MKKLLTFFGVAAAASSLWAAKSGSCESAAIGLRSSQAVTLTAEYDPDEKEYYDDYGVAYYKIRLNRGASATIWIQGGDADSLSLDVAESENSEDFISASFDTESYSGGIQAAFLESGSWDYGDGTSDDPGDPKSVMFYVKIEGEVGQQTTLYYQSGIRSFTVTGEEGAPHSLTFKASEQTVSPKLVGDGEYWFKAKLTKGYKYLVRTTTANESLDIDFDSDIETIEDTNYSTNCVKYWVVPSTTATYKFYVSGDDAGTKFTMKYKIVPQRKPAAHNAIALTKDNVYSASVIAGRMNDTHDYYDQVADETLCSINLEKGTRWAFETVDATGDIRLDVYDKDGKLLTYNTSLGNNSKDCRAAVTATYSGMYYVGVYDPLLEVQDEPPSDAVFTLRAIDCATVPPADGFDPTDDAATAAGATLLAAASGAADSDVAAVAQAAGTASGPHAFNAGDWYDCYRLPVRSGVTYRLIAALTDEEAVTDLSLGAKVFTLSGTKETAITTSGALFPSEGETPLTFTAKANAVYYIRVWVRNTERSAGYGLDFPEHAINAIAYMADGTPLGQLQVKTKGTDGTWYIGTDKKSYPNGAMVNVPTNKAVKVVFNAVSGFSTPGATNVMVAATGLTPAVGVYNDSYDKYTTTVKKKKVAVSDDDEAYAIALAATGGKTVGAKRTLWTDDPADHFKFTAAEGVYYNLDLVDTTLDGFGDATFSVMKDGVEIIPATTHVEKRLFDPGVHILKVVHADDAARIDSSYRLDYSTFNAGKVKFSAATYSVAENAAYATLKLQRTNKEGAVRVNWATQAGTNETAALPGKEYYPASGIVAWKAGDKADKTIQVRLIPDLVANVESNKSFTVKLWEIDGDDIEDDEFPAVIARDEAKVVLTEVTAKGAGTISAVCYGEDDTPFASVKKPVMTATAGGAAEITLRRSGHTAQTKVAVKATVVSNKKKYKDTAVIGRDVDAFSEIIEWDDGDDDEKSITIPLGDSTDYTLTKQFTVTLAALTTGEYKGWNKPKLSASAITVKIANETAKTAFATFAKGAAANGVTAKSVKGTWFVDGDGTLRSAEAAAAAMTLTVNGPGLFIADPSIGGESCDGTITCKIGKGEPFVCSGDKQNRFARIVPAGKQAITFTLAGGAADSYMAFNDVDGSPYKWIPFKNVTPADPMAKAAVTTDFSALSWTGIDELESESIFYRVRLGTSAKSQPTVLTNVTVDASCEIPEGTLASGKTYYWTLDFAYPGDTKDDVAAALNDPSILAWTAGPSVWNFSTVVEGAQETATDGIDVFGVDFYDAITNNSPIQLVQGVKTSFEIGPSAGDSVMSRIAAGSLPPGLSLDGRAKKGVVSGTPTKAGTYTCLLQTATGTAKKPVWATTLKLTFEVLPVGTSVGSFRGVLVEDGSALEIGAPRIGLFTFSVTSAGKLSAKANIAGRAYAGSKTGFDEVVDRTEDGQGKTFEVTIPMAIDKKEKSKVACKGELVVTLNDWPVGDLDSFTESIGSARLHLNVPNAKMTAVLAEADYSAELYRNNSGLAEAADVFAPFKGYYTVALAAPGVTADSGVPAGHGYLTLTVDAKGGVKAAGRLADGTAVSGSSFAAPVGDLNTPADCLLCVPLAFNSTTYSFGGVAKIVWAEGEDGYAASILDAASSFRWYKDGASATLSGEMLDLELEPSGGWYNTVPNLQAYYLDRDFTLDGVAATLAGNAVKLSATKGETASAMTYSLARATGLATGTLTYAGVKKIKHYGVLLMNRDAGAAALDLDVWTAGFFLHKVSSSWTESLPFDILSQQIDRDWNEAQVPSGDDGE